MIRNRVQAIGSSNFIDELPQSAQIVEGVCSPVSLSAILCRLGIDQILGEGIEVTD